MKKRTETTFPEKLTHDCDLYVINTSNGILQFDRQGSLWFGGGRTFVLPAVFYSRKEAKKYADIWRKRILPDLSFKVNWVEVRQLRVLVGGKR